LKNGKNYLRKKGIILNKKMNQEQLVYLEKMANKLRLKVIEMLYNAKSGHPGGALSSAEVVSTLYFGNILNIFPNDPYSLERDIFILSAGHYCPIWYAALAFKGFFEEEELITLRKFGSRLLGHPKFRSLPGIENSGGSLGQGFSIALGCAQAFKLDDKKNKVFCLLGDGEQNEGQVWEAAMFASHNKLDNLIAIIDVNKIQIDGYTEYVLNSEPLDAKYEAFGWNVQRIDGNDIAQVYSSIQNALLFKNKPSVIIADTIAGKGVKVLENTVASHGKWISKDVYESAKIDLGNKI
jgi:transketolase